MLRAAMLDAWPRLLKIARWAGSSESRGAGSENWKNMQPSPGKRRAQKHNSWFAVVAGIGVLAACLEIDERTPSVANGASSGSSGKGASGGGTSNPSLGGGGDGSSLGGDRNSQGGGGEGPGIVPSTVGTVGEPCSTNGAYGCAGVNQRLQLLCNDGLWESFGQCEPDERCDTREESSGLCQTVIPACSQKEPGDAACEDLDRFDCGPDLVTRENLETCEGACVAGACAACMPGETACLGNGRVTCNDNGAFEPVVPCPDSTPLCSSGTCMIPPSCEGLPSNCGAAESCCKSLLVDGGTFLRSNTSAATISDFRLDKFEVTVGRFRQFVNAVEDGWLPQGGSGKHAHLNDRAGLKVGTAGHEWGWQSAYNSYLPSNAADWGLDCSSYSPWTPSPGSNEQLPIGCVDWYKAFAFCVWDGGFLPSEAEWNYAAAGGSEQRDYPWGSEVPGGDAALAAYGCYYGSPTGSCSGVTNIAPVGTIDAGFGAYGQADLAGNMSEWTLDWWSTEYELPCDDCMEQTALTHHVHRGGNFVTSQTTKLLTSSRQSAADTFADYGSGLRCARSP
jgi:formylglycine-generating enzyme